LRIIKGDENLKTILVVVLTSSRESSDLAECYEQGVNAYVVKPVDYAEFAKAVSQIGGFWVTVNEPPPNGKQPSPGPGGGIIFSLQKKSPDALPPKS
jgi:hypothetical protein